MKKFIISYLALILTACFLSDQAMAEKNIEEGEKIFDENREIVLPTIPRVPAIPPTVPRVVSIPKLPPSIPRLPQTFKAPQPPPAPPRNLLIEHPKAIETLKAKAKTE